MELGMSQSEVNTKGWRGINIGSKLKEVGTTHWLSPNADATNSSDFTALAGGIRQNNGNFSDLRSEAAFWSSTESSSSAAWPRQLSNKYSEVRRYSLHKSFAFSVRCIKDK